MARTGTHQKFKVSTLKQQRENAQLEDIIERFGRAMRNADRPYMAQSAAGDAPRFTPNMYAAWNEYLDFCWSHQNEQA